MILPCTVQAEPGYNSWPMIQTLGSSLICVYSKGKAHLIDEPCRGVYARRKSGVQNCSTVLWVIWNTKNDPH